MRVPQVLLASTIAILTGSSLSEASWQFLSRPDLNVPTLNITHHVGFGEDKASELAPGLFFVAPFAGGNDQEKHGPLQPGPYLFDDSGNLVWTGFAQYYSIWTVNLQKTQFEGRDALLAFQGKHNAAHGHGHGVLKLLDSSYNVLKEVRAGHHRLIDKHEGQVINDGRSALFQIYHPVPRDLSEVGGDAQHQWIVDAQFQEVDVGTGKVLFEWRSLDHVPPTHSNISLTSGQAGDGSDSSEAWDYFHINSVDKDSERSPSYLISARDVNSIYKINGTTGEIIWRLGGRNINNDFEHLDEEVAFSYQHHARFHGFDAEGRELVSVYDNSAHGTETDSGSQVRDAPTSSGKIIALDHSKKTASTVKAFYPPFGLLSKSQGSTHLINGTKGNVLVNWGSEGAITEYSWDGKILFHAFLDSGDLGVGLQNYRAFKNEWHGSPDEESAVAGLFYDEKAWSKATGLEDQQDRLILAASWNGDTEVQNWRFYLSATSKDVHRKLVATVPRTGFETRHVISLRSDQQSAKKSSVLAEGVDKHGKVLTTTRWERIESSWPVPPQYQSHKGQTLPLEEEPKLYNEIHQAVFAA